MAVYMNTDIGNYNYNNHYKTSQTTFLYKIIYVYKKRERDEANF